MYVWLFCLVVVTWRLSFAFHSESCQGLLSFTRDDICVHLVG